MSMIGQYRRLSQDAFRSLLAEPAALSNVLFPDDEQQYERDFLDLDKSWHLIHFLLNGDPWEGEWPLGAVVLGGTEISDEDLGYGPARYFTPTEVRQMAVALGRIGPEELWSRFDAESARHAEIYPQGWSDTPEDREYVCGNYERLRAFVSETANRGDVLIAYMS
jgi:hypothetical protein